MRIELLPLSLVCSALLTASVASAQAQTDVVEPASWTWNDGVSASALSGILSQNFRMVDIERRTTTGGTLRGGTFVRNTGAYGKGWWWYTERSQLEVNTLLNNNGARLIDLEPFDTPAGLRFDVVMIPNSGADFAVDHGYVVNQNQLQVAAWVNANPSRRIIDVQNYEVGGATRYAFIWVQNTGLQASPWAILLNQTSQSISDYLAANNMRLVDLEHHDGTGRMSAVMQPDDGAGWVWFFGTSAAEIERLARQYDCRMIDSERYLDASNNVRHSCIARRNDNDETISTVFGMRSFLPLSASSGFLARELDGAAARFGENLSDVPFEPASSIKLAHHYFYCDRVARGFSTFDDILVELRGQTGSCPNETLPQARRAEDILRDMMESSSNTATDAIRLTFGELLIQVRMDFLGAEGIELNHVVGCLCGQPRNQARLGDLFQLHRLAVQGDLGTATPEFYDLMLNSGSFGMGSFSTTSTLVQELAASTLSDEEKAAFVAAMRFAHKGGSYTCIFPGGDREDHRSVAAFVELPLRSGCDIVQQPYFIGAWVNDAETAASAEDAVGYAMTELYRARLRTAIGTWEAASCTFFESYCAANPNSTGQVGQCEGLGSPYVLTNGFAIAATNLPPNTFCLLLASRQSGFTGGPGGSEGNLCLGGAIGRFQNQIVNSGPTGGFLLPIDLQQIPQPSSFVSVMSGDTFHFQVWHRDVTAGGAQTSNYTRGLRARFL